MKFGLSFLPDANGFDLSATDYYRSALKMAQLADEGGMSTIKITEHYLHPYGGFCPDPTVFLAAVAATTKQIRLMTGCILPAFHHPVKIAAKTAMLDVLSNGRLDVGFARAYLPHEFAAFNVAMDGSRELFINTIDAVIKLWTEDKVTMNTSYFQLTEASSYPKPIQLPHPPVWGAAVLSRQSFAWLGEKGFHLLVTPPLDGLTSLVDKIDIYRQNFLAHHPTKQPKVTLSMPLLLAKSEQEAKQLGDHYLQKYLNVWADAAETWSHHRSNDYLGYAHLAQILRANTPEKMRYHRQALIGTPESIRERILEIQEMFALEQIIWQIDFGAQPEDIVLQTLTLFLDTVMPFIHSSTEELVYANESM